MTARNITGGLVFLVLAVTLLLVTGVTAEANDDFSLRIIINGEDISGIETIVIDPEKELKIDLRITGVSRDITLREITIAVTFASQTIVTQSETLGNFRITAGESFHKELTINTKEALQIGGRPVATGIYRSQVNLEYAVEGREEVRSLTKNIKIPGNPLTTPAGAAGAAVSLGAMAAIIMLVKSVAVPGLPAGTVLPAGTTVKAMPGLYELAMKKLESTTRGRVVGNIVNSAKRRIIRDICPMCQTRLKHGHCYTCKKSTRELRNEYTNRLKDLALEGGELIASGEVATPDELGSRLGISGKLGTDVIATLKHAKLIKVRGLARKVTGKAITTGISSGLSAIIWVTVGGFAVLSTPALVGILIAAIIVPLVVVKSLQMKARRAIRRAGP